jgi:hypothetical protein
MMELSIYLLQGTYPKKMKSVCREDTYTPMFINKTWKQPRYLSMDEWFCNVVYAYTVEYYSTLKRNGMPVTERQIPCNFFFYGTGFDLRVLCLQSRHLQLEPHLQSILLWLSCRERWGADLVN